MYENKNKTKLTKVFRAIMAGICLAFFSVAGVNAQTDLRITDANPMEMPAVGSYGLRILTPTMLELTLISTKAKDGGVTNWNFVANGTYTAPSTSEFTVTAGTQTIGVSSVGFKRRPLYAPLNYRDLRIGNQIYLQLSSPIAEGATVTVKNPSGKLWSSSQNYSATASSLRWNPAIHVNGEGYMPNYVKKAMVGYYLGSMGELAIPSSNGYKIVDANSGAVVYSGSLTSRKDVGYSYSPTPYQQVYEADFSSFNTPGEYRLQVPSMGASFAFMINEGIAASFARSYALGLYHQRCGHNNDYPYSRHQKGACHVKTVLIPDNTYTAVNSTLANVTGDYANSQASGTPQLKDVNSSLYPFVNKTAFNASGGHHDAGDYSKYTINVAQLAHSLVFAADAISGVSALDNLGLPESGDGKSDVLQIAKWELDFLAKLQDADGGFYFLVYPKDRRYEDNVSLQGTDLGDQQVVFPKTTAATAASVAALAQAASSPLFKQYYPTEAANYLAKAKKGWAFLETAWSKYGREGAYQKITHYGNEFRDRDEIAWAACEMYLATGESKYHTELTSRFDPADPNTRRWTWWRMFEGYGCAVRSYAFAARTGRLSSSALNSTFLAKCEAEIIAAGDDQVKYVKDSAYANPFPTYHKPYRSAGWFMSVDQAFDIAAAYQLSAKQDYIDATIGAMNYEAGCNPLNMGFLTGVGWKRQRETVNQYANNDRRVLPPSGIPIGSVWPGEPNIWQYGSELGSLPFPSDSTSVNNMFAPYEKWTDTFHTATEMVNPQQAHGLAATAWLMARTSLKTQPWKSATATITGLPSSVPAKQNMTIGLSANGLDLSNATIVWEGRDQEPTPASQWTFAAKNTGPHWVEAEALLPDGRRVFAKADFNATTATSTPPNGTQSAPLSVTQDMAALYHLDADLSDATGKQTALTKTGNAALDSSNLGWMQNRTGQNLHFLDLGDQVTGSIKQSDTWATDTQAIILEAMIYVNAYKGYNKANATILSLERNWAAVMELREDMYGGPIIRMGNNNTVPTTTVNGALTKNAWHHIRLSIDKTGYTVKINGNTIATFASSELNNWSVNTPATLKLGNFDGWIDEVVVRHVRTSYPDGGGTTPTNTVSTVSTPTITPNGGTFTNSVSVALATSTSGATVRYTTDGSTPTTSSPAYTSPFTLTNNATVKAFGTASGMSNSAIATATFTIVSGSTGGTTNPPPSTNTTVGAVFVKTDTTTLGNWKGVYGNEGYNVIGEAVSYPAYATVTPGGKSDWTWQSSTTDANGLQKANASDRILALWYSPTSFSVDVNITDGKTHRLALYMVDWDKLGRAQTVEILGSNGAVINSQTVSGFSSGRYLVWDISGKVTVRVTRTAGSNAIINGLFLSDAPTTTPTPVNQPPTVSLTAPANGTTVTAGANVTLTATAADADGTVSKVEFFNGSTKLGEDTTAPYSFTWSSVVAGSYTLTARATDNAGAATTSSAVSVTVNAVTTPPLVTVATPTFSPNGGTFTNSVSVSLACATAGATIRYTTDGSQPTSTSTLYSAPVTLVDTKTVKAIAFSDGTASSVASAQFNIVAGTTTPPPVPGTDTSATFVRTDTKTRGNWKKAYGKEGYNIIAHAVKYPSYAQVTPSGNSEWVWKSSTSDTDGLVKVSTTDRILAGWYSATTFSVDVNITDGKTHRMELYFTDWDKLGRAQKVEILDGDSGAILSSQTLSGFANGRYLVWQVSGKIKIRITRTGGPNCILNGIFFDAAPLQTAQTTLATPTETSTLSGSEFQLLVNGEPGQTLLVERSTDLVNWAPIATNTLSDATEPFIDTDAPNLIAFYRATPLD